MLDNIVKALVELLPKADLTDEVIDCHHNYVAREEHFGEILWITRKGAIRAAEGEWGIIPGSMGTQSYVVRGHAGPESFESCAHGAGRFMSRTQAKKHITLERFRSGPFTSSAARTEMSSTRHPVYGTILVHFAVQASAGGAVV